MTKFQDLINQSKEELNAQVEELSREIYLLASDLKVDRKLDNPHLLKEKKKMRARILTALNQKRENI